jgi:hypothetical protein
MGCRECKRHADSSKKRDPFYGCHKITTVRYIGASAVSLTGGWSSLLSRNGIERGGFDSAGNECVLDNEVYAARNCILFDQSDADQCVRVPMKSWRR